MKRLEKGVFLFVFLDFFAILCYKDRWRRRRSLVSTVMTAFIAWLNQMDTGEGRHKIV